MIPRNIVFFSSSLGQKKNGVQKNKLFLYNFMNMNCSFFNISCNKNLYNNLSSLYNCNFFLKEPIINIGGDHSMAISTVASSLNKYKDLKVIWIDAHPDINTFKNSKTKNYHGMPLSFLTGLDYNPKFSFIKNILPMKNILYIGIRDIDDFEKKIINEKKINYISVQDIRKNFKSSMVKINNFIDDSPIHVSFDVDAIDPKYLPCTGTPVKNGLNIKESKNLMKYLEKYNLVTIDITELNLELGSINDKMKSISNFFKVFKSILGII